MSGGVRRRDVDVHVDDDFNDGVVGLGGDFTPPDATLKSTPAGSTGGGGLSNTIPPADTMTGRGGGRRRRGSSTREPRWQRGGSIQPPETRSTRREQTPPRSGVGRTSTTGGNSPGQTESKQRRSGTTRQEHRSVSTTETTVKKGGGFVSRLDGRPAAGPVGTGDGAEGKNSPRPKRRSSNPVQQKAARTPTSSTTPAGSGGTIAPPGPAGTGRTSYSGDILRFRDRSPSPARRELPRGAIPGGVLQKDGTPRVHSRPIGTRGRSPAPPKQRSTNPARQEQVKPPEAAGLPVKGGGPVLRPGPAGTVKGPHAPKRSTRAKSGSLEQGGTHGKPRS